MPLLNYTTSISAEKTLGEIQCRLQAHGAKGVMIAYDGNRQPHSLVFVVPTAFGDRSFQLPANAQAVLKTLESQWRKGKVPRKLVCQEQAARVAWRIIKDWTEAQLAIVESGMVTLDEVMFPYMLDSRNCTAYQVALDRQLQLGGPAR